MQFHAIAVTNSPRHFGRRHSWKTLGTVVLMVGLALSPIACSTSKPGGTSAAHSTHETHADLELNNGSKWAVATPMMVHIRNLEKAVQEFEASGRDHPALATDVQEHLGRLVTNCTMEGKAHDELHKWLMPFLGMTADYSKATEPRAQQEKLKEIRQALVVFNEHFQ